ncbi:MAG: DUF115 domain-containing protein [Treponema sp.]|jgi:hypothetical protein|nr:DUF115 domain-containing protein [Treponema sp.]
MDKQLFERNLLALSKMDGDLCARLSSAITTRGLYRFIESRTGESIPALTGPEGAARPLHSTVDPRKEGERLISTLSGEGYVILLGLGGGFAAEAALKREETKKVLAIEYDRDGLAELLSARDYILLFQDPRFRLLADPPGELIAEYLLNSYFPALDGGIRVFPLRARADGDGRFTAAGDAIKGAIDAVSRDYSAQAYFGKRWFSNIIRNLPLAERQRSTLPPVKKALICAAGPSLEEDLPRIRDRRQGAFLIATDTSLPALLQGGIEPEGVISIDCQHISYHHFFLGLPAKTALFLDLASPPPVAARTENRFFFSSPHPLGVYIRRLWRPLPALDTSGANVTYAAFSLAETLGAGRIEVYGADFSYPRGKTYARGTYIYPYFEKLQTRFLPLEAQHSGFLYRDSSLRKQEEGDRWYYETQSLRFYREALKRKTAAGAGGFGGGRKNLPLFSPGPMRQSALDFLRSYRRSIEGLHSFAALENPSGQEETELAATLLPLAASVRKNHPSFSSGELFEEVRTTSLRELSILIRS